MEIFLHKRTKSLTAAWKAGSLLHPKLFPAQSTSDVRLFTIHPGQAFLNRVHSGGVRVQRSRGYLCSEATLPSLEDSGPCWTAGGGQGYWRVCPAPSDQLPGQLCPLCCPQGIQKSPWGLARTGLRVVLLAWRARPGQWLCSSKVKCKALFAQNERAFLLVSTD